MTWGGDKSLALARSCPGTALMSNQWRLFSVVASRTVGPGRSSRFIQRRRSISSGSSLCTPMGSDFTNRCSPLMQRMRETSAPDSPIVCRSIGAPLNVWDHWVGMYILSLTQVLADLLPVGCMTSKTQTLLTSKPRQSPPRTGRGQRQRRYDLLNCACSSWPASASWRMQILPPWRAV